MQIEQYEIENIIHLYKSGKQEFCYTIKDLFNIVEDSVMASDQHYAMKTTGEKLSLFEHASHYMKEE